MRVEPSELTGTTGQPALGLQVMRGGYLTIARWGGAPVRLHWSVLLGAFIFSRGRFLPGFWLAFFGLVLVHELGHALWVRRFRLRVVSIDVLGFGGLCRWSGSATPVQRAVIAWGGVLAQGLLFAVMQGALTAGLVPRTETANDVVHVFTSVNLMMIALNLIPFPPLDGAEAWRLPGLLWRRGRRG